MVWKKTKVLSSNIESQDEVSRNSMTCYYEAVMLFSTDAYIMFLHKGFTFPDVSSSHCDLIVSDSLDTMDWSPPHHGLEPSRLLYPWNSPGKNTGVACHALLQGIFPIQGLNPGLPHCRQIRYHLSYLGPLDIWYIHLLNFLCANH